jgi:Trypsin-co-occurring domain 1
MVELVAVPLENGGVIVVEMDHAQAGVVKAGRPGQIVGKAAQTLEAALESVTPAVQSVLASLRQAGPREITVEFGLTLTAEAGVVIAKAASGCHLTVTLRWKRDDESAG